MSGALDQKGIAVTLIHAGARKVDANPWQPLPEAVRGQMRAELENLRQLFARIVVDGRGDRIDVARALGTEAAVFRGEAAVVAGLADEVADPVTAFRAFTASAGGIRSSSRKGPQMTATPTGTPNPNTVTASPPTAPPEAAAPEPPPSAATAPTSDSLAMTAEAIRAEAAEVAQVCVQAARLGVQIDAADAVARGLKPEALRARVLADLAARSDAAGIVATAPAAAAKESPIVAAAKKTAAASR